MRDSKANLTSTTNDDSLTHFNVYGKFASKAMPVRD